MGDAHLAKGDEESALVAYRDALRRGRGEPEAHERIADLFARREQWDLAEAEYQAALLVDPLRARTHLGLGRAYRGLGRLSEAREAGRRALELDPTLSAEVAELLDRLEGGNPGDPRE
jgi:tetratricopeptide (TPR) repeat protein